MLKYTYYGHSCFVLDDGKSKVLADPFLTGNPKAAITADKVECDYILVSHAHGDHLGDAAAIARRTGAKIIGIPEVLALCEGCDGHGMNVGGRVDLPFGYVRMVPAIHSCGVAGGIACGFVINIDGINIYFAGDTCLFSDMKLIGEKETIDYAVVPIGGNYTMDAEDAAQAVELLEAANAIPVHYNTWPVIEQDPKKFKQLLEAPHYHSYVSIVEPGETIDLK